MYGQRCGKLVWSTVRSACMVNGVVSLYGQRCGQLVWLTVWKPVWSTVRSAPLTIQASTPLTIQADRTVDHTGFHTGSVRAGSGSYRFQFGWIFKFAWFDRFGSKTVRFPVHGSVPTLPAGRNALERHGNADSFGDVSVFLKKDMVSLGWVLKGNP